jgi:methionine-gamma-lyase
MSMSNDKVRMLEMASQCVHSGTKTDEWGSVVQPIYQTSTFRFKNADHGARLFQGEDTGYIYSRISNPTIEAMEDAVAILEGGARALGCASGMSAIFTLIGSIISAGDHIICTSSAYGTTITLLQNILPRFSIETSFVHTHILDNVRKSIRPNTKLILLESPCNPTMMLSDISEICKIAKEFSISGEHNIKVAVDNTFCSPILQRPLALGADYVIHSMTKYLNGHADVVAGIIVLKDENEYPSFRSMMNHYGGITDPFNSFLVHRGLKTLKLRVEAAQDNAQKIAEYLEERSDKIEWVLYPGLKSHPQYELGKKQTRGAGSVIVFEVKGGIEAGKKVINNTNLIQLAVSLGGIESLIEHPASMTHALMGTDVRKEAGITDGLIRLSVGIEDISDLIKELDYVLSLV